MRAYGRVRIVCAAAAQRVEPKSTFAARRRDIRDFSINLVLNLVGSPFLLLLLASRKYEDCLLSINIMRARGGVLIDTLRETVPTVPNHVLVLIILWVFYIKFCINFV